VTKAVSKAWRGADHDTAGGTMNNQEKLQREKAEIWSPGYVPPALRRQKDGGRKAIARLPKVVAEGDSWFDYLPGMDVLDNLRRTYGYDIERFAEGGDTLANMVYGTEIGRNFRRKPAGIVEVLDAVRKLKPDAVLFSAGGNDIAGDELMSYLHHIDSSESQGGASWLRGDEWRLALQHMESAIQHFAQSVWTANPKAVVVMHGYARPVPDGRAVINIPGGWHFIGPWLRPSFAKKGYIDWAKTEPWIGQLLDDFNELLASIARDSGGRFKYVDVRPAVGRNDWANELHPTNEGFAAVAKRIDAILRRL